MRRPLRSQILIPFSGLVTAAVIGVSAVDAWRAARAVDERIDAHLSNIADVLLNAGFPLTDAVLQQVSRLSGAEFVYLDEHRTLRASSSPQGDELKTAAADAPAAQRHTVTTLSGAEYGYREVVRPDRGTGDAAMRLQMFYPQQLRRQLLREAVVPSLAIGVGALVAATLLSYVLAGRIVRPLSAVRRQFMQLGEGNYASIELPACDDEIRDLVESANLLGRQLEERTLAVQRSSRAAALGRLSGGLCHHLRNAAAGAKLAVQLHARRCASPEAESLQVAERELNLIAEHLQRLLTLGKPQPLDRCAADATGIAWEAAALVEPTFKHRGITLRITRPEGAVLLESVDAGRLRQSLVDLLLNAVEAAPVQGGWAELIVSVADDEIRYTVNDSGDGPPADVLPRLFEAFVSSKPDGVGLGLAAARRIVEDHGGSLRFFRRPHTSFEIVLPRSRPSAMQTTLAQADLVVAEEAGR